ncbi:protein-disulfide reductase DsbD domain-containing protein [Yeosuana marina]|uniref:protein-disulfide reductase DsbD domain-containing protein n=1 Tax=Yeosuana marina TaxID=1565536 RepID=UPI0030EE5C39|tara:strand:+ start:671 stop:1117 length:447 start_codon:yes stop_codon:yes gene_type:complete
MKHIILAFALIMVSVGQAQILKPVKWEASVKKISDTEYELIATANIDEHWHLYSQTVPEGGPIATTFTFQGNGKFLKKGNTIEDEGQTIDDPVFGMKIKFFETKASFKQRIKLKTKEAFKVNATVEFMVCDDSRCLPPTEVDLVFNVN